MNTREFQQHSSLNNWPDQKQLLCCLTEDKTTRVTTTGPIAWRPIPELDRISPFCFALLHQLIGERKITSLLLDTPADQAVHLINADLACFIHEVAFLLVDDSEGAAS